MSFNNLLITLCVILLSACGFKSQSTLEENIYRGQVIQETGDKASYESEINDQGEVNTKIEVNGKTIHASYDDDNGLKSITADTSLDARDKLVLKDLFAQIKAAEDPNSSLQTFTASFTDYLSESPVGHVIPTRTFEPSLSLYNEGVKCIKKGQNVYGQWDTASGQTRGEWVRTNANYGGNYGCMGRCGGGCGWGAPSSYTKDCMDHDICSKRHNASGGSGDRNCGDEFNQAADDWATGVARGCRG